jgi:hypothetical protein
MKRLIQVVSVIIILVAAGFGIAALVKKHQDKTAEPTPSVSVYTQDAMFSQPMQFASTIETTLPTPSPQSSIISAPSVPTPTPVATPTPAQRNGTKVYTSSAANIRVTIPTSWEPQEVQQGSRRIIVFRSSGAVVATIEAYANIAESLDAIAEQLQSSASVSNIKKVTIGTAPALQYTTPQGTQLVTKHATTVYYLTGQLATNYSGISF